ncbi:MAG: universal stress protein [Boseongicola sp.]|nr:universal stress protein [Boseongicola sp.]
MTQHIICAVDLNHKDDAKAILTEASRIAGLENATLSVVTVLPDFGSSWVGSFFKDDTLANAAEAARVELHELADSVLPNSDAVQCIVEIGSVYEEVVDAAVKCNADLIIVGAHKPDFTDRLVGPNAARVVRHSPVSVLVARLKG